MGIRFDLFRFTASSTPTTLAFQVQVGAGLSNLYWRPFCIAVPGASWSKRDFARLVSKLQVVDTAVKPGVLGQVSHQAFRTGAGATGSRPSASTVGVGAQWFDTTLNRPIWSTGSGWINAAGTTV